MHFQNAPGVFFLQCVQFRCVLFNLFGQLDPYKQNDMCDAIAAHYGIVDLSAESKKVISEYVCAVTQCAMEVCTYVSELPQEVTAVASWMVRSPLVYSCIFSGDNKLITCADSVVVDQLCQEEVKDILMQVISATVPEAFDDADSPSSSQQTP